MAKENKFVSYIVYPYHIAAAIYVIIKYIIDKVFLRIPVSYPGGPRPNPQTRIGKWSSKPFTMLPGWLFASDYKSHEISMKYCQVPLTGESAGRQIWYKKKEELKKERERRGSDAAPMVLHAQSIKPFLQPLTFDAAENPNSSDKLYRNIMIENWTGDIPDEDTVPETPRDAAMKALSYYQMLQCDDGHWAGDYGGPMFLMPGLIITLYITRTPFLPGRQEGMVQYLLNHQQEDGGWGTHIECASTMFGSVLSYVSLRLLGEEPDEPHMVKALKFIASHGGALYAPSWAKFWLAILGVYDWSGVNPVPSEMWLLPRWLPFHPGRLWCHCRMVYLPMGYLYCEKFTADVANDPLLQALRKELYSVDYDSIDFNDYRQVCADIDAYVPLNPLMKVAQDLLTIYEWIIPRFPILQKLRKAAQEFAIDYIRAEDAQTNSIDIGPVNKSMNMLSVFVAGGCDFMNPQFQMHIPRVDDYLWVAEDGVKMQGYNGSQCWDTAFITQAICEGGFAQYFPDCMRKCYSYLRRTQIKTDEEDRERWFRHQSKGGWPFSTAAHGWPIADCTADGMKAVLAMHCKGFEKILEDEDKVSATSLKDAVDVILSYHNVDGGWATYENNRGYGWYELLNPSEVFGDIMIDYSYVELSSTCISALNKFSLIYPTYRTAEVINAITAGASFIKSIQRDDGSWYGSWAVCFVYGTWFGIEGLIAAGESPSSPAVRRAVKFLLSKQNDNGGWGENYLSCVNKTYHSAGPLGDNNSNEVQTAWALLSLLAADCEDKNAIDKGIAFLMKKQLPTGDWSQGPISGVFNRSCGITYSQYRNIFPIWALGRYSNKYSNI